MATPAAQKTLDELTLGDAIVLEDLVDREALSELVQSFYDLFGIPLRIFSETGQMLADTGEQQELYRYLNTLRYSRAAVQDVVGAVKRLNPADQGEVSYPCVTGAIYRVVAINYGGRHIGRMILGPFLTPAATELPKSLLEGDPDIDQDRVMALFSQMPRSAEETVTRLARHLARTLDLILFSGHRSLLTTKMHLSSVRESYRELQEKNAKLQQAYDRLKELDRLKSNFLATVSHELRTPLTSIIGYSEMLVEGIAGDMAQEQRDFVRTIYEKGEQLLHLIKGLLDLSKLESGTMSLTKTYVAVGPLVRDVAQTMAPTARKKGVDLHLNIEAGLPELWADPARVRQILLNLTENAIKFTPSGGKVTLGARLTTMDASSDDGGGLVLLARRTAIEMSVSDTGIGIPLAERDRVFDAFYQIDSSSTREQGGTGLGLSIVKRLVDSHDGRVTVEDNKPRGAVFVVTIPCRRATVA